MKAFLKYKEKFYTKNELIAVFKRLGIREGDCICVHTELMNLGTPLVCKEEFLSTLVSCFLEVLTDKGTLIMPTFTYSFCKNYDYDKLHSKSTMGVLTEFFRKKEGVVRTNDPIFSFAIWGAKTKDFLKDTPTCFGEGCVYDMLHKNSGKIVLFGTENLGYTFTHFIEEKMGVDYRYFKEFSGNLIDERGAKHPKSIKYFVRDLKLNLDLDLEKNKALLKQSNNFKKEFFGNAPIVCIDSKLYLNEFEKVLRTNPYHLLKEEKNDNSH